MLYERIWPNEDYNWLTGLVLFFPRAGYSPNDRIPALKWFFNPQSVRPASNLLKEILLQRRTMLHSP